MMVPFLEGGNSGVLATGRAWGEAGYLLGCLGTAGLSSPHSVLLQSPSVSWALQPSKAQSLGCLLSSAFPGDGEP